MLFRQQREPALVVVAVVVGEKKRETQRRKKGRARLAGNSALVDCDRGEGLDRRALALLGEEDAVPLGASDGAGVEQEVGLAEDLHTVALVDEEGAGLHPDQGVAVRNEEAGSFR